MAREAYDNPANPSECYVWGYNASGQCSVSNSASPWPLRGAGGTGRLSSVACGWAHTCAISSTGVLYSWGSNEFGQLGDGTEVDRAKPACVAALAGHAVVEVACGSHFSVAITAPAGSAALHRANKKRHNDEGDEDDQEEGGALRRMGGMSPPLVHGEGIVDGARAREPQPINLWVWGRYQLSNVPQRLPGAFPCGTVVVRVACGKTHAAAVSADGLLMTWGYNECGQLGFGFRSDGQQRPRLVAEFAGDADEGGGVEAGGDHGGHRLVGMERAHGGRAHHPAGAPGVAMPSLTSAAGLVAGLASNTSAPPAPRIRDVACGDYHTVAVTYDGSVYSWGSGELGQLGHATFEGPPLELLPRRVVGLGPSASSQCGVSLRVARVGCGQSHSCALTDGGAFLVWGYGQHGALGTGREAWTPFRARDYAGGWQRRGIVGVEWQPRLLIPRGVLRFASGDHHMLAYLASGRLLGWGYNQYGQATGERRPDCWEPTEIDGCIGEVTALAAGGGHSAVITYFPTLKSLCERALAEGVTADSAKGLMVSKRPCASALYSSTLDRLFAFGSMTFAPRIMPTVLRCEHVRLELASS
eukprot:jgi/Mesvir1/21901/Mv01966-RA.1